MNLPSLNQSPVVFDSKEHTYLLNGRYLRGVTGTLVRRAYPDTYSVPEGMSEEMWAERLRKAALNGTTVHQTIELYEDLGVESDLPELKNYISIKNDNGFINIATEYIVSDEENYASAIDHVWFKGDDIVLIDIKRTAEVHLDNVTCQLSIYKRFFEKQNPHLVGKYNISIALLWLRGNKNDFHFLNPLTDETLDALIEADLKDESFDIAQYQGNLPVVFSDAEQRMAMLDAEIKEKKRQYDDIKKTLMDLMVQSNKTSLSGTKVQIAIVEPTMRESFDMDAFRSDNPELYEKYKYYTNVKSSLRVTIKK